MQNSAWGYHSSILMPCSAQKEEGLLQPPLWKMMASPGDLSGFRGTVPPSSFLCFSPRFE